MSDRRFQADPNLRRREQGRVLIGGSPLGIIRLSERGAQIATDLFAGNRIGDDRATVTLADRLVDRGMAHPDPSPGERDASEELCVIIPVRNDLDGLRDTLKALPPVSQIVVVDDASRTPLRCEMLQECAPHSPMTIVRNSTSQGPGGARNAGLAVADSPCAIIAFCDAGVLIDRDSLALLRAHLHRAELPRDGIVAVAPRITVRKPSGNPTTLDRYEQQHSPLDLGPLPSLVRPGARVSYVPTACLLVRRAALRDVGPFDPDLRYGEDVDLIWRLCEVGDIRYEPRATATHPRRRSVGAFARQRFHYGSAAGPLGRRHGQAVTPLRASVPTVATLGLVLTSHPVLAALATAATTNALARKLGDLEDRGVEAARFSTAGMVASGAALAKAGSRAWWPWLVIAGSMRPSRRIARRWAALSLVERVLDQRTLDPRELALGMLDDVSYGAGVWFGAFRARTVAPIAPAISRDQSGSGSPMIRSSSSTTSRDSTLRNRS